MGEPTVRAGFEAFYLATLDPVYRAVLLVTRDPARAQDAVHDGFLRALQRWDVVSQHPNPKAWLIRVALNSSVSAWRVWRREQADPPPVPVEDELPIDPILLRAVFHLPKRQRQVVALRVLLDLGQDQTAELLGIAPGTVGLHLASGPAGPPRFTDSARIFGDRWMSDDEVAAALKKAFDRYGAPTDLRRSIGELQVDGVLRGRGSMRLRVAIVALLGVATALVLSVALATPPARPQSAFAGWVPTPTTPDPTTLAWARANCLYTGSQFIDPGTLVLQDQRGSSAYFLFENNDGFVDCFVKVVNGQPQNATSGGGALFDHPEQPIQSNLTSTRDHLNPENDWAAVTGRAAGAVRVEVILDSHTVVLATVKHGLFIAWWPGDAWPTQIRAFSGSGATIGTQSSFPPAD